MGQEEPSTRDCTEGEVVQAPHLRTWKDPVLQWTYPRASRLPRSIVKHMGSLDMERAREVRWQAAPQGHPVGLVQQHAPDPAAVRTSKAE